VQIRAAQLQEMVIDADESAQAHEAAAQIDHDLLSDHFLQHG
jgi:hypothetical protein